MVQAVQVRYPSMRHTAKSHKQRSFADAKVKSADASEGQSSGVVCDERRRTNERQRYSLTFMIFFLVFFV